MGVLAQLLSSRILLPAKRTYSTLAVAKGRRGQCGGVNVTRKTERLPLAASLPPDLGLLELPDEAAKIRDDALKVRGTTIQDLDAHCLGQIMSRLDEHFPKYALECRWEDLQACSLVCREWLDASNFARKTLTLQGGPQIATLPRFLLRFPGISGVQFVGAKTAPDGDSIHLSLDVLPLSLLGAGCRNLRCLRIWYCLGVSNAGLATVLKGCKSLQILWVIHSRTFTGAAFRGIQYCRGLERIKFDHCHDLTREGLAAVAAACPNLSHLNVTMKEYYGGADLAAGFEKIASSCPRLVTLFVQACGITDTTLRSFAVGCPLLSGVYITEEPGITDAGVAAIRLGLPRLEILKLFGNGQLFRGSRRR